MTYLGLMTPQKDISSNKVVFMTSLGGMAHIRRVLVPYLEWIMTLQKGYMERKKSVYNLLRG